MKKKVLIRAPLLTVSGYGVHSRQVFKWLLSREDFDVTTHVVNWGTTSWMVNPEFENGLVGEVMKRSNPGPGNFDLSFQVQLPDEWDSNLASFNVGITAGVETDICNPDWITAINKMDLVIVPSSHVKNTFERTGDITTKIAVVHESFHEQIENAQKDKIELEIDTNFNFLLVGQFTGATADSDRKNIFNTLKWMCEVFKDDPDVGLIIKTNHGKNTKIDKAITKKLISDTVSQVRPGQYPKVHLLHGHLSGDEISSLYIDPSVKAFVSLTRGEGFGLPLLEAAASGLPVIVTDWSGHLDFLQKKKFIPVHYKLIDIPKTKIDKRIFVEGAKWAEPIENDFKKKVKKFRHNYEMPGEWAKKLMVSVRENFSQEKICKEYNSIIPLSSKTTSVS
jgi:glycosyltransferase involved in cell wall biosynthesis